MPIRYRNLVITWYMKKFYILFYSEIALSIGETRLSYINYSQKLHYNFSLYTEMGYFLVNTLLGLISCMCRGCSGCVDLTGSSEKTTFIWTLIMPKHFSTRSQKKLKVAKIYLQKIILMDKKIICILKTGHHRIQQGM